MMVSICVNPQKSALNDSFREQSPNDSNYQWTCPSLRYPNIILSNRLQPMAIVGVSQSDERASPDEPFIGWRKVLYNRFGRQKRHKAYYTLLYYINIYIYTYYIIICIHTCINCWCVQTWRTQSSGHVFHSRFLVKRPLHGSSMYHP